MRWKRRSTICKELLAKRCIKGIINVVDPGRGFLRRTLMSLSTYIQESIAELRQVRWPTRQQAIRLSIITIGFTFAVAIAFGAIDSALGQIVKVLLSLTY